MLYSLIKKLFIITFSVTAYICLRELQIFGSNIAFFEGFPPIINDIGISCCCNGCWGAIGLWSVVTAKILHLLIYRFLSTHSKIPFRCFKKKILKTRLCLEDRLAISVSLCLSLFVSILAFTNAAIYFPVNLAEPFIFSFFLLWVQLFFGALLVQLLVHMIDSTKIIDGCIAMLSVYYLSFVFSFLFNCIGPSGFEPLGRIWGAVHSIIHGDAISLIYIMMPVFGLLLVLLASTFLCAASVCNTNIDSKSKYVLKFSDTLLLPLLYAKWFYNTLIIILFAYDRIQEMVVSSYSPRFLASGSMKSGVWPCIQHNVSVSRAITTGGLQLKQALFTSLIYTLLFSITTLFFFFCQKPITHKGTRSRIKVIFGMFVVYLIFATLINDFFSPVSILIVTAVVYQLYENIREEISTIDLNRTNNKKLTISFLFKTSLKIFVVLFALSYTMLDKTATLICILPIMIVSLCLAISVEHSKLYLSRLFSLKLKIHFSFKSWMRLFKVSLGCIFFAGAILWFIRVIVSLVCSSGFTEVNTKFTKIIFDIF